MGRQKNRPSYAERGKVYARGKPKFAPMAEGADAGAENFHTGRINAACDAFFVKRGLPVNEMQGNSWGFGKRRTP